MTHGEDKIVKCRRLAPLGKIEQMFFTLSCSHFSVSNLKEGPINNNRSPELRNQKMYRYDPVAVHLDVLLSVLAGGGSRSGPAVSFPLSLPRQSLIVLCAYGTISLFSGACSKGQRQRLPFYLRDVTGTGSGRVRVRARLDVRQGARAYDATCCTRHPARRCCPPHVRKGDGTFDLR